MFHNHSRYLRKDDIVENLDKDFDLLVSGDAMVDTITGGPVRRESF